MKILSKIKDLLFYRCTTQKMIIDTLKEIDSELNRLYENGVFDKGKIRKVNFSININNFHYHIIVNAYAHYNESRHDQLVINYMYVDGIVLDENNNEVEGSEAYILRLNSVLSKIENNSEFLTIVKELEKWNQRD